MSPSKLTPEKLTAFCAALAETCNVGKACAAVGVSRTIAYRWRDEDPDFAERWEKAMKIGLSGLEDEAHRRGFEGVREPLVHQGQFTYEYERDASGRVLFDEQVTGEGENRQVLNIPRIKVDEAGNPVVATIRKYSDTLAIFLLKAHAPEKYRENSKIELSGHLAVNAMTDEEIAAELASLVAAGVIAAPDEVEDGSDLV